MPSLDTNILLRLMLNDVPAQTGKIIKLLETSRPHSLQIADAVWLECVWILTGMGYSRADIAASLLDLMEFPQFNCNRALIEKAVPVYAKHPKISFIDACLAVYAELNDAAPLVTFDKALAKQLPEQVRLLS